MKGRFWVPVIVVFILFAVLDFLLHGMLLSGAYKATASVWRPMEEMNSLMWLMYFGTLIHAFFFVFIFTKGYEGKGIGEGIRYGMYMGLFFGIAMSIGTYASMPVTGTIAWAWLLGTLVESVLAGAVVARLYKPPAPAAAQA
jgi:hypothetical protein